MNELITLIGVPIARNILGWFQKYMEDGKISDYEWKKLVETILRIGIPGFALYYGFSLPVDFAITIPFLADYVYHYINKIIYKAKKK